MEISGPSYLYDRRVIIMDMVEREILSKFLNQTHNHLNAKLEEAKKALPPEQSIEAQGVIQGLINNINVAEDKLVEEYLAKNYPDLIKGVLCQDRSTSPSNATMNESTKTQ